MRQRERRREDQQQDTPRLPTGDSGGDRAQRLRRAGEEFLAAADAAIDNALSGDSEKFNEATRQEGGQ